MLTLVRHEAVNARYPAVLLPPLQSSQLTSATLHRMRSQGH